MKKLVNYIYYNLFVPEMLFKKLFQDQTQKFEIKKLMFKKHLFI
jgi:hypothetical protein